MTNQSQYKVGNKVIDSDGNSFSITEIIDNNDPLVDAAVTLRGAGGEKEIGSLELKFYKSAE